MSIPDLVNGVFEFLGGGLIWLDVRRLKKDREVKGVSWPVRWFFTSWGVWNLYYYPSLDQWASFAGGVCICAGNLAWCILYLKIHRERRSNS